MEKTKTSYKAIEALSDDVLKQAYEELKVGLPKGEESIVRGLQSQLYNENKKSVALASVQYKVAMEMLKRFYD